MNLIDWATIVIAGSLGIAGARAGLIAGGMILGGFAFGALLGSRIAPALLSEGAESAYAPLGALLGGIMIGTLGALAIDRVATRVRSALVRGGVSASLDSGGGAVLFAGLGFAVIWILGAVALHTPGFDQVRRDVQRSALLSAAYEIVPPQGDLVGFLRRIDPLAAVRAPSGAIERPPRGIAADPAVLAAGESVVRVTGSACGLGVAGSGWVAGPGLVVTNAHVVAGQTETVVETSTGARFDAIAVAYRPEDDIAVLRAEGLESAPVAVLKTATEPRPGRPGAILGYPGNGPFAAAPARLGATEAVRSEDSYGRGPVTRTMTVFRGRVIDGNSGGPVVDSRGRVLATVFASAIGADPPRGLGIPNKVARSLVAGADSQVGTGPCAR